MTTADTDVRERRRFMRHASSVPLHCHKEGHTAISAGETSDVSFGGVSFILDRPYSPGDVVSVQYPSLARGRTLKGEIVWCRPLDEPDTRRYANGLRFLDEETHFRARLVEQICHIEAYRKVQRELGRELSSREAAAEWIGRYGDKFPQ